MNLIIKQILNIVHCINIKYKKITWVPISSAVYWYELKFPKEMSYVK